MFRCIPLDALILAALVSVIVRVALGVVAKVETLCHMDGIAKPFTEVRVVELATTVLLRAFVVHDFHEILEWHFHVSPECLNEVLGLDPPIVVEVQLEKSLPD